MDSGENEVKKEPDEVDEDYQFYLDAKKIVKKEETCAENESALAKNTLILKFFITDSHPTTMKLMSFARSNQMSFQNVFDQFEQLRRDFGVICTSGDSCQTIRRYFPKSVGEVLTPVARKNRLIIDFFLAHRNPPKSRMITFATMHSIPINDLMITFEHLREISTLQEVQSKKDCTKNKSIIEVFAKNPHPVIRKMIELSDLLEMSYKEVFLQFEKLRVENGQVCQKEDTCCRVRCYFDEESAQNSEDVNWKVDLMLEREFARLDSQKKTLDEGEAHPQIAERQRIHPSYIQKKYNEPRKYDCSQMKSLCGVLQFYPVLKHPSIDEMIEMGEMFKISYKRVFAQFEEYRESIGETCRDELCICEKVRKSLNLDKMEGNPLKRPRNL